MNSKLKKVSMILAIVVVIALAFQILTMVNQLMILNDAVSDLSSGNADLTKLYRRNRRADEPVYSLRPGTVPN